jgi:aminopeptidase N
LPIYTFALYAGPYCYHEEDFSETIPQGDPPSKIPPMKIFTRKSLIDKIDHKQMFKVTRYGMKYFSEYFGFEYPFSKYDQLFTPSMPFDGLSSQGMVTFSESFLYTDKYHDKET